MGTTTTAVTGTINFGGKNLTVAKDAFVDFGIFSTSSYTTMQNINTLNMNGTIRLHWSDWKPAEGDSIQLFRDVKVFAGTPVMESLVVDKEKGLYWDASNLAEKGYLLVTTTPTGMKEIDSPAPKVYVVDGKVVAPEAREIHIYTLEGIHIDSETRLRPGVYIVIADGYATKISVK